MSQAKLSARATEMHAVIKKYLQSNLTQKAFCEQQSIPLSTFLYWLGHYRNHNQPKPVRPREKAPFIPLELKENPVFSQAGCYLEFNNGTRLSFDNVPPVGLLLQLVRSL